MAPFYGWGSTASRLQPLRGGTLLFTIQFPEIPGTQSIYLYTCHSLYTFPIQWFSLLLERQVNKDNELGIINNVGKSRLVKVIFTTIYNISDTCANSFVRYIMIAQCIREMFLLFIKVSLEKWCS